MTKRRPSLMPHHLTYRGHWLYAMGLTGGWIKVGCTSRPRVRLQQHRTSHGEALEWFHLGPLVGDKYDALYAERQVVDGLAERFRRFGTNEVFETADKGAVLTLMREVVGRLRDEASADETCAA